MERYLIPANGPETAPIIKALQMATEHGQKLGVIVEVVLLTPSKNLTGSSFEQVVGNKVVKELEKGNSIKLTDSVSIKMESERTINVYSTHPIVIALYANQKMLDKIDSLSGTLHAIIVPWTMIEVQDWIGTWRPMVIGERVAQTEIKITNPVVEEAMKMLTGSVNLSTGLNHPSDKAAAVELFRLLYNGREEFDPTSIRAWALLHGWNPKGADQIRDVAEAIINRRPIRGGTHPHWRVDILDVLRKRTTQKS